MNNNVINSDKLHSNHRLPWIDVAKSFSSILVVMTHILDYCNLQIVISFCLPAFFMFSGLCFSSKISFFDFLKKKFRQIMIPYYIWGLIAIFVYQVLGRFVTQNDIIPFYQCIIGLLSGTAKSGYMQFNLHLWFLPVLFVMQLIFYPICKTIQKKDNKKRLLLSVTATVLLTVLSVTLITLNPNIVLPLGIITALKLIPFFSLGYVIQHTALYTYKYDNTPKSKVILILILLVSLPLLVFLSLKHYSFLGIRINYSRDILGNIPLFFASSLCCILLFIVLSFLFQKSKILIYIGQKSLPLLLMQKYPIILFKNIIPFTSLYIKQNNILVVVLVTIIVISLCLLVDWIIVKYFPWLYGIKNKRRTKNA
ncbi:MAG: acyltransferase [Clostridia bacterium]|nr:acyltransferase [Clostridia bacterium]